MFKYKHFLGYGVVIPNHILRKSPYRAEKLDEFRKKNQLISLDTYSRTDNSFIGFLLDYTDDDFLEKMKSAENHIDELFYDIVKMDIPAGYKKSMVAKCGDIWED